MPPVSARSVDAEDAPSSTQSISWAAFARSLGWSSSTASRHKPIFNDVLIRLPGMRDRIVPAQGLAILRGERVQRLTPPRRGRGRPRKVTIGLLG